MSYLPSFPEPGSYLRYWDIGSHRTQFLELVDKRGPLTYNRRLGSLASGASSSLITLPDLEPDRRLSHRYMVYIGVKPGAFLRLWHPYDFEQYNWDKAPQDISRDVTRKITYRESPAEKPTISFWVEPGRYPGVIAVNVMERTIIPEVVFVAAKYRVKEENPPIPENAIDQATLDQLRTGAIPSMPVYFGGEL